MRDAFIQPATPGQIAAFARQKDISEDKARVTLAALRDSQIGNQRDNPFVCGYEPPIWFVAKALMRNPYWSDYERKTIARRTGLEPDAFSDRMRLKLGFRHPVARVLVMGSNRSGKTDFAAKLCVQAARAGNRMVCSGAQTLPTQKQNQMQRLWHYLPNDWKRRNVANIKAKDAIENISFTVKNGFAGSKITFDNGSVIKFITYKQDVKDLEGTEYDLAHLDEEYGIEQYNLFTTRVTSKAGTFLGTFTPLHGYTPQVAAFLSDSVVTRYHTAYLRPTDGGEKLPWKELNLEREEYERLVTWREEGMLGDCDVPESRPEDCFEWLFDRGDGRDTLALPHGRVFDRTPRVCVCQGGQAAAVWFYGSDNPYGLPSELMRQKMADQHAERKIMESVYGVARELKGQLFSTFRDERNVIDDAALPPRLVRFMVADPAPERNWCMGWFGLDPETDTLYWYREWPSGYAVPGQGVPGAWAVLSDRNGGMNDGDRGEGQASFGFGYDHIKFEVARLERWRNFTDFVRAGGRSDVMPDDFDEVEQWGEVDGVGEQMVFRLLDSRAAAQSKISAKSNNSLLVDLEEYLSGWAVADGQRTEVGLTKLSNLMSEGRFKVCRSCVNALFCLRHYTGRDGQKGAMKDFVDLARYAVMSDIWGYGRDLATVCDAPAGAPEAENGSRERQNSFCGRNIRRSRRVWW